MTLPAGLPPARLHHVGILVADLDAALQFYRDTLGLIGAEPHDAPAHDIRAALLDLGQSHLELFAPLTPDGAIAGALAKRGPGLHHLCYEVDDIVAALASCRAAGVQLIDAAPRPGLHHGWQVAFLHPRSCGGVLTELVQTGVPSSGSGR
jgi:methylmalonyl-CoA/ethylmalonyl-CoA epimerase